MSEAITLPTYPTSAPTDTLGGTTDAGFYTSYLSGQDTKYGGFMRDHEDGYYKFFKEATTVPNPNADFSTLAPVYVNSLYVQNNLTVDGLRTDLSTLNMTGSIMTLDANNLADTYNSGFLSKYVSGGTKYSGLIRKAGGEFVLTKGETTNDASLLALSAFDSLFVNDAKADSMANTTESLNWTLPSSTGTLALTSDIVPSTTIFGNIYIRGINFATEKWVWTPDVWLPIDNTTTDPFRFEPIVTVSGVTSPAFCVLSFPTTGIYLCSFTHTSGSFSGTTFQITLLLNGAEVPQATRICGSTTQTIGRSIISITSGDTIRMGFKYTGDSYFEEISTPIIINCIKIS